MIDFEKFEEYLILVRSKPIFIKQNELINYEEYIKIKNLCDKYTAGEVINLIERCKSIKKNQEKQFMILEDICPICNNKHIIKISKTEFGKLLNNNHMLFYNNKLIKVYNDPMPHYLCNQCFIKETKRRQEQQEQLRIEREKQIKLSQQNELTTEEKINKYIETYLNPNISWKEGISLNTKWNEVILLPNSYDINYEIIADHIKSMNYKDFLQTLYWKTISEKKRRLSGFKCQLCDSKGQLHTHHRTYKIHGYEHLHLDDLIVLCNTCHEKHHDIVKEV